MLSLRHTKIRGYTLMEMAIATLIGGVMVAAFTSAASVYLKTQAQQITLNNASLITGALNNYLVQTGSYPCPAPIDVPRTDPNYGLAGNCADTGTVAVGSCGAGNGNGYCVQASDRVWAPGTQPASWTGRVRRGSVPFRTLGVPEFQAEDGYRTRFEYAVTEALAVQATYDRNNGGIDIYNGIPGVGISSSIVSTVPNAGSAHYVIISTGPDRAGGYNHDGGLALPCPVYGNNQDSANCETTAPLHAAQYVMPQYSTATDINHFDDTVKFYSSSETPLWQITGGGVDLTDLVNASDTPNAGKVGIQTSPDPNGPALQINGNALAEGNLLSNQLCQQSGSQLNCYQASMSWTCPAGQVAIGFAPSGSATQGNLQCGTDPQVTCPSGQILQGIDASGNLVCKTVVSCASSSATVCLDPATGVAGQDPIPAGALGTTYTTPISGASRQFTFQCQPSGSGGATWVQTASTGVCSCIGAGTSIGTEACNVLKGGPAQGWTGLVNISTTKVCPAGTTTTTYISDTCACNAFTTTSSASCGTGYTGSKTTTQDFVCVAGSPGTLGHFTAKVVTNSCTCDPTVSGNQTLTCTAAGYSAGYSGHVKQTRNITCNANVASWGSWTTVSDTCTCSAVVDNQTVGCPAPEVGTENQTRTFNCATNSWGPWITASNTCGSVVYKWQAISGKTGPTGNPGSVQVGQTCTTSGQTGPCTASAGNGNYWQYSLCQCE